LFSEVMNALTTFSRLIARGLLLALGGADRLAEGRRLLVQVELLEQLADRLRAHSAAEVDAEPVRRAEAVLQLPEDLLVVHDHLRLEVLEQLPGGLEPADGLDRGLTGVVPARLDVHVHLAHLHHPLDDRVVLLLGDLPVGLQAEVARELADRLVLRVRRRLLEGLLEEALAEIARLLEVLDVDRGDERSVFIAEHGLLVEQPVDDPVDVLGDGALLRARRLCELLVERRKGFADLDGRVRNRLELARGELAVGTDRRLVDPLADLLRILGRDLRGDLDEEARRRASWPPRASAAPAPPPSCSGRGSRSRRPRRSPSPCSS
jgi:hypothetical protein